MFGNIEDILQHSEDFSSIKVIINRIGTRNTINKVLTLPIPKNSKYTEEELNDGLDFLYFLTETRKWIIESVEPSYDSPFLYYRL